MAFTERSRVTKISIVATMIGMVSIVVLSFRLRQKDAGVWIVSEKESHPLTLDRQELANVDSRFKDWELNPEFLDKLRDFARKTPINPATGYHIVEFSVCNAGFIEFAANLYCSSVKAGIPKNRYVFIATDMESYETLSALGASVIHLASNFTKNSVTDRKILDYVKLAKLRPTILHQFLLWGLETVLIDSDVVILEDFIDLFSPVSDMDVGFDSKELVAVPTRLPFWEVNMGILRFVPTDPVLQFFPEWLSQSYVSPKVHEQKKFKTMMRNRPQTLMGDSIVKIDYNSTLSLKMHYLDPMLVTNPGATLFYSKDKFRAEAKRRGIRKPKVVHLFHCMSINQKRSALRSLKLRYFSDNRCVDPPEDIFPVWKL